MKLRRETVKRFWCPDCEVGPGLACIDDEGNEREKVHKSRVDKADRLITARLRAEGKFAAASPPRTAQRSPGARQAGSRSPGSRVAR